MAIAPTKTMVKALAKVLDEEYDSAEEAAEAAMLAAFEMYEARAKFTVVGQVKQPDGKGDKVALGWYATENQATQDALKLTYSTQTHEEHRAWVLKVHHGTPNDYYIDRKKAKKADAAADASYRQREMQRRIQWFEDHPGEQPPLDWTIQVAFDNQTDECEACKGMGRIPKPELPRRIELVPVPDFEEVSA